MERSGLTSMSQPTRAAESVGPVLIRGRTADALVLAIRATNTDVEVIDRGAYLRVLVPGSCRLSRVAVEAQLGASFRLPADLEEVMPSFKGRLAISEQEVIWYAGGEP
jgi:MmoB/DmpM family